ncbi:MAG: GNAT family N-acetyltransferase [Marinilabiliales bacterium]|nr:MAG: GNAT family N-acetyltransferase [Marinilabiliales bacterium]
MINASKISLRFFEPADAERLAFLANNKKIWLNLRDGFPHPYTLDDAREFIERNNNSNPQTVFAILYEGDLCGAIGIFKMEDVYRKSAEIGYWIAEPYWGKGIASESVSRIVEFGFKELDIVRIYAGIFSNNTASQRVIEKNGFIKEAVLKNAVYKNNALLDEVRYAILKK